MKFRTYQDKDREALIALWQRVFPDDPPHNDPSQVISAKRAVDDLIFVALEEDFVVGAVMAGYDGHRGWLYAVAVDHAHRRHGIARHLVRHTLGRITSFRDASKLIYRSDPTMHRWLRSMNPWDSVSKIESAWD